MIGHRMFVRSAAVVIGIGVAIWGAIGVVHAAEGENMVIGDNTTVRFEYTLAVDGKTVDSSQDGEPVEYTHGRNQILPGLERQMMGLHVGDIRDITVSPDEGYGSIDPEAQDEVQKSQLPSTIDPQVGMRLTGRDPSGRVFLATIKEVKPESVVLDLNHPLAGKTLNFHVKVLEVKAAPAP